MDFRITLLIVTTRYNNNIDKILKTFNVKNNENIDVLICSKYDNPALNFSLENVHLIKEKFDGVVDGFNKACNYLLKNFKNTTHVAFISDNATFTKSPYRPLISLIKKQGDNVVFSCNCFRETNGKKYVYSECERLNYRELLTSIDHLISYKKTTHYFNPLFFVLPIKSLVDRKTPDYLYTFLGCNDSRIFGLDDVVFLNNVFLKDFPLESKMMPRDLYYFYRNGLIIHSFLGSINHSIIDLINNDIDAYLVTYRYNDVMAITMAVLDYLKGEALLSKTDFAFLNRSLFSLNPYLRTSNEIGIRYDWRKWNQTRTEISEIEKAKNIESFGYIDDQAEDLTVIDLFNQKPFTTFNVKKILNWDLDYFVGYVSEKRTYCIEKCLEKKNEMNLAFINQPSYKLKMLDSGKERYFHNPLDNKDIYEQYLKDKETTKQRFSMVKENKKKVVFFVGVKNGFCSNPKYVLLDLINRNIDCYLVWISSNPASCKELDDLNVRIIDLNNHDSLIEELTSAHIIVYDDKLPLDYTPRETQILINTWHGGFNFKRIGLDGMELESIYDKKILMMCNPRPNYFIAGCQAFLENTSKSFEYNPSTFLPIGLPRNDLLVNKEFDQIAIKKKIKINPRKKVCLYAPTFRNDNVASTHELNFKLVAKALHNKFGGDWQILYRGHVFTINFGGEQDFLDVSMYPDQQEIIAISDVIISDYSSIIWDASILKIPIFLYAPDYYDYLQKERGFTVDLFSLPYSLSLNNEELITAIANFDLSSYTKSISLFLEEKKTFDDGNASKKVVNIILENL